MNDLDLSGLNWEPIGLMHLANGDPVRTFTGSFDGNNHTISNLEMTKSTTDLNKAYMSTGLHL
jgi:hypothetical protein